MSSIPVKQIHLELSSRCNSACQLCPRYTIKDGFYTKSPLLEEQDLPIELLEALLAHPALAQTEKWLLCGNLGEPMMHPQIVEIVDLLIQRKPRWLTIHTNGGMGTVDMWRDLGRLLPETKGQIIFSLDGLEDTNHLYRRNVNWDAVMRNAQAFIAAGGNAVWKFIDFEYNHHQIDAARSLAAQLGFARFAVDKNSSWPLQPDPSLEYRHRQPTDLLEIEDGFDVQAANSDWRKPTVLDCEHLKYSTVYVDAQAKVWPCCHLVTVLSHGDPARRAVGRRWLIEPYGADWNDLKQHDIGSILNSSYWRDLYVTLQDNSGLYKCSHSCGTNPVRTREREMQPLK